MSEASGGSRSIDLNLPSGQANLRLLPSSESEYEDKLKYEKVNYVMKPIFDTKLL